MSERPKYLTAEHIVRHVRAMGEEAPDSVAPLLDQLYRLGRKDGARAERERAARERIRWRRLVRGAACAVCRESLHDDRDANAMLDGRTAHHECALRESAKEAG